MLVPASDDGNVKDQPVRVTRTDAGTWEVSVIDPDDYPKNSFQILI